MMRSILTTLSLLVFLASSLLAQGLNTNATKDDWEEINFETGSAVLVDGFPSLLRLAELLAKNDGYRVKVEGHGDPNTPARLAEKLGMARANTVKQFLEKYGARPAQISVATAGNTSPKVGNGTKEGRFMNRRVNLNVTDPQGRNVSAAGVGDAIRNLNAATGGPAGMADPKCCDEILKRLDKLDDILALLRGMKADHDTLKQEVAALKANAGKASEQAAAAAAAAAAAPKREEMAAAATKATEEALSRVAGKKLSLLGLNAGADNEGRLTFTGKGRFFNPFNNNFALQAEGEYMYFRDRQEGQFDLGLVNRYQKMQMGLFSSFKQVNFREYQSGGTLGQAAATVDYVFNRGRVGVFGTKGFLNNAVVNRTALSTNVILERYLRIVDQVGGSGAVALWRDAYFEGNLGYLRTYSGSKPGMTARLVQPLNSHLALSFEGGLNETLVARNNSGAFRVGVLFGGSWLRPKDYRTAAGPVPVDIPRVRYELLSRRVRTGNDAPVADAGPDQTGVTAGTIQLDGSASYDPDGDPITYEWRQIAGPAVTLNGAATARASFPAAENQTYAFRLTVKDDRNAMGTARVTVTTRAPQPVRILRYQAAPTNITAGQTASLLWLVENAESVEISGIGRVDAKQGTTQVTPTQTTSYRLTAKNATSETSETVTVTVTQPQVRILSFNAVPTTISRGESSTLTWQTENAESVTISGVSANLNVNGSTVVSPTATTTYTITATGRGGATTTATATVLVGAGGGGGLPRIIRFTPSPMDIQAGNNSRLNWLVENADQVNITSLGTVGLTGEAPVSPTANTLYTLTATNAFGSVSSTVGINVRPAPPVPPPAPTLSCTVSPSVITTPGDAVNLSFTAQNARVVTFNGLGTSSPVVVRPTATTTYTLIAYGANDQTAQCQATVTVNAPPAIVRPIADAGPNIDTIERQVTLTGAASSDPEGLALTYRWRALERTAAVLDPNSAVTRVQLGELFGPYSFELTVTNSKGVSASKIVTVNYLKTSVR
ncbi:MAG: PKD domain-containing protein [Acidobacteriota bacterium]